MKTAKRPRASSLPASFGGAEEAWFWTMSVLLARQDGAALAWRPDAVDRPCDPEDIIACVDTLYRQQSLTLAHARVIRHWGALQQVPAPVPDRTHRLWHQAMGLLEWKLRARGIVR